MGAFEGAFEFPAGASFGRRPRAKAAADCEAFQNEEIDPELLARFAVDHGDRHRLAAEAELDDREAMQSRVRDVDALAENQPSYFRETHARVELLLDERALVLASLPSLTVLPGGRAAERREDLR